MANNFHPLLFHYKYLGSIALKCGASHFGFRSTGHFEPLQHLVIIFKSSEKRANFLGWLEYSGLESSQYYHRHYFHKDKFVYMVFINSLLFIKPNKNKLYFSNFRQLCRTSDLIVYKSGYSHPHSDLLTNKDKAA